MTTDRIAQILNPQDVMSSEQQDALEAKTCNECDHKCDKLDKHEECCECRDNIFMDARSTYCVTCADRCDRQSERNYERFCESFYGGEIVTLDEQLETARRLK